MSSIFTFILAALLFLQTGCGSSNNGSNIGASTTIKGTVQYEDREYGQIGFTGNTTFKPVRYATVEVVNSTTDEVLASGTTDSAGMYSLSLSSLGTSIYVRVFSETVLSSASTIEVRDIAHDAALFSFASKDLTPLSDSTETVISIPYTNSAAGAFNIMNVFTSGAEFVKSISGGYPPSLKTYWASGNQKGTYYCTGSDCSDGEGIYVLNDTEGTNPSNDTDEYDDDVLWHEYGHFIANKFSRDDTPGGIHYLDDTTPDLRLAWSEGWGNFSQSAIKTWLKTNNLSLLSSSADTSVYVDTSGSTASYFDISLPGQTDKAKYIYSSNELAVANILWRTMNETKKGMLGIWDVLVNYIPLSSVPINLETFYDGWLISQSPDSLEMDTLETIYSNRSIFYLEDSSEPDDVPTGRKAEIGTEEIHYLYRYDRTEDKDIVPFYAIGGVNYTIETSDLKNGADTYIILYDSNMNKTAENDNRDEITYIPYPSTGWNYDYYDSSGNYIYPRNDLQTLSSKITFPTVSSGIFYVEVKRSPNAPKSSGRYGTYTLIISQYP